MNDTAQAPRRLALVIDADNAQPSLIQPVLLAAASRGRVTVRRIYGDWTSPNMTSWKAHLLDHSIRPIQQFRIVGGKNATDSAMIIDAMDLLHSGLVDGFCIVSSDSDFTSLARRIQESGLFVMGVGRRTTPLAFQRACEEFVFTDDMRAVPSTTSQQKKKPATGGRTNEVPARKPRNRQPDAQILELLAQGIRSAADEDTGWAGIGRVGQIVRQFEPGFSHKDYGHASLSSLLESHPELFRLLKGDNGQAQVQLIERSAEKQLELLSDMPADHGPEAQPETGPDDVADTPVAEAPAKSRRSRPARKPRPAKDASPADQVDSPAAPVSAGAPATDAATSDAPAAKPAAKSSTTARTPRRSRARKPAGDAPAS